MNQKQKDDGRADSAAQWRLPTVDELMTLVSPRRDADLFGETGWFWSSSPNASNTNVAWFVDFYDGNVYWYYKNFSNRVRLVRADKAIALDESIAADAPDRLQDNADGTHTDRRTGLVWRSEPEPGLYEWDQAIEIAEGGLV